jgi:DNA-binding HxlR family transcriptional regulator
VGVTKGYGTYCPVSLAAEIVGERWTIPLLLALTTGTLRFNELRRALPRIPPSTLSQRLRSLEDAGVVRRRRSRGEEALGSEYALTEAGLALEPVLHDLGYWAHRWARDLVPDDLDTRTLAWSMHTRLDTEAMPDGRTVLEFDLSGDAAHCGRFWLVHEDGRVEVCVKHPGHEVSVRVVGDLRVFTEAWRGFRSLRAEIAAGRVRLEGPRALVRAFPGWLLLSAAADTERLRPGRERALRRRTAGRAGAR